MSKFIFWCLKWLAILTIKYTNHPDGMFQLGASVVVDGKRYPFIFEGNTIDTYFSPLKYDLKGEFARKNYV